MLDREDEEYSKSSIMPFFIFLFKKFFKIKKQKEWHMATKPF